MEQVKSFCRRYRWLLLTVAYLAIFAVGVLYLRVTVNIPPEGDDKLTLNRWLYDFQRMPFWQYALQDLQGRLRYFTLQEVRFFPFHYPNAVDLLFYTSLTRYRLYIIAWTGAAAFSVSRVAARLGSGDALALGGFTLALAAAPIWNEGMYSYYAVPQRALFWAMTAWLCLFAWQGTHHRRWAVLGAVLSFIACGTYEIGYVLALLAFVVWFLRGCNAKNALLDTAPALGGMGVALVFHMLCGRNGGTGNELSLNIPVVLRVTVQQMAASIPGLNSRLLQEDAGVITNGDRLWPLVLGVLAGLLLFFGRLKSCAAERWAHWPGSGWLFGRCPPCCWPCPPAINSPMPLHGNGDTFLRLPVPSALHWSSPRCWPGWRACAPSCRKSSPCWRALRLPGRWQWVSA